MASIEVRAPPSPRSSMPSVLALQMKVTEVQAVLKRYNGHPVALCAPCYQCLIVYVAVESNSGRQSEFVVVRRSAATGAFTQD